MPTVRELMEEVAELRAGFERELAALREELRRQVVWERERYLRELTAMGSRMEELRVELIRTVVELRAQLDATPAEGSVLAQTAEPEPDSEAQRRQEMADALVAAVERLRARIAEVEPVEPVERLEHLEPIEPEQSQPAAEVDEASRRHAEEPVVMRRRTLSVPPERVSWLAPAIRRVAERRDAKLAAELVVELLPAQRQLVDGPLGYEVEIDELGSFYVELDRDHATISREGAHGPVDFSLRGSAAALGELAAGGVKRRQPGLWIRKGRRLARRMLKARRVPLSLVDLIAVGVDVWPGLLLLAMAESIDPSWTSGSRFDLAFEIRGTSGVVIYVSVCDGGPIQVSRQAARQPLASVSLSERGLMGLLAGVSSPPEEEVLVSGDVGSVEVFLDWAARAQGLSVASA